jgi:DNA-binding beta-propeller fold protein YncE
MIFNRFAERSRLLATKRLFISSLIDECIYVIDLATCQVVDKLESGQAPAGLTYCPENKRLYVANNLCDGRVSVLDTLSGIICSAYDVASYPVSLMTDTTSKLYVLNQGYQKNAYFVMDLNDGCHVSTVAFDSVITHFEYNHTFDLLYVATTSGQLLSIHASTGTPLSCINIGSQAKALSVSPKDGQVHVVTSVDTLLVFDGSLRRRIKSLPLGFEVGAITADPQTGDLYLLDLTHSLLLAIDCENSAARDELRLPSLPSGKGSFLLDSESGVLFLASEDKGVLFEIDVMGKLTLIRAIPVPNPYAMALIH